MALAATPAMTIIASSMSHSPATRFTSSITRAGTRPRSSSVANERTRLCARCAFGFEPRGLFKGGGCLVPAPRSSDPFRDPGPISFPFPSPISLVGSHAPPRSQSRGGACRSSPRFASSSSAFFRSSYLGNSSPRSSDARRLSLNAMSSPGVPWLGHSVSGFARHSALARRMAVLKDSSPG